MKPQEIVNEVLNMVENKVRIYDGIKDPTQRKYLKLQIVVLTWCAGRALYSLPSAETPKELDKRHRDLEKRFPA